MYVCMCVCSLFLEVTSPAPSKHVVLSRTRRNFAAWLVGPWTRLQPSADAPRPPHSPADWLSRKKSRKFTDHQGLAIAFSHILEHTTQKLQNDQNVIKKPHQYDDIKACPRNANSGSVPPKTEPSRPAWRFSVQVEYTKKPPGPRGPLLSTTLTRTNSGSSSLGNWALGNSVPLLSLACLVPGHVACAKHFAGAASGAKRSLLWFVHSLALEYAQWPVQNRHRNTLQQQYRMVPWPWWVNYHVVGKNYS